jgi:hypothetical protein
MTRDKEGKFIKGTSGNPKGRPRREREENVLDIMVSECSPDKLRTIINKAIEQAVRGDSTARKWLFDYLIGSPIQRQEVSGVDGKAVEILVTYEDKPATAETS